MAKKKTKNKEKKLKKLKKMEKVLVEKLMFMHMKKAKEIKVY